MNTNTGVPTHNPQSAEPDPRVLRALVEAWLKIDPPSPDSQPIDLDNPQDLADTIDRLRYDGFWNAIADELTIGEDETNEEETASAIALGRVMKMRNELNAILDAMAALHLPGQIDRPGQPYSVIWRDHDKTVIEWVEGPTASRACAAWQHRHIVHHTIIAVLDGHVTVPQSGTVCDIASRNLH